MQDALAALSGVWQETISKVENGAGGTKPDTVCLLSAALDIEVVVRERSKGSVDAFDEVI